jgi:putative SOS response-associated peptidase YedK
VCGRFAQGDTDAIYSRYRVKISHDLRKKIKPRYNIAPTQIVPTVYNGAEGEKSIGLMRWGFIPSWARDPKIGYRLINARAETVSQKPSFRNSFRIKRCIVPATGFYEWYKRNGSKIPHYIYPTKEKLFSLAGLYDQWKDPEGKELTTFTILTTEPNAVVKPIHDRMPVILEKDEEAQWLDSSITNPSILERLFDPYPASLMNEHVVSTEVNSPRSEGKELIQEERKLL